MFLQTKKADSCKRKDTAVCPVTQLATKEPDKSPGKGIAGDRGLKHRPADTKPPPKSNVDHKESSNRNPGARVHSRDGPTKAEGCDRRETAGCQFTSRLPRPNKGPGKQTAGNRITTRSRLHRSRQLAPQGQRKGGTIRSPRNPQELKPERLSRFTICRNT